MAAAAAAASERESKQANGQKTTRPRTRTTFSSRARLLLCRLLGPTNRATDRPTDRLTGQLVSANLITASWPPLCAPHYSAGGAREPRQRRQFNDLWSTLLNETSSCSLLPLPLLLLPLLLLGRRRASFLFRGARRVFVCGSPARNYNIIMLMSKLACNSNSPLVSLASRLLRCLLHCLRLASPPLSDRRRLPGSAAAAAAG